MIKSPQFFQLDVNRVKWRNTETIVGLVVARSGSFQFCALGKGIVCTNGGSGGISCPRGNACDIFRRRGT